MKTLTLAILVPLVIVVVITGAALVLGGPSEPPPMPSINNPFKNIDYSDLPAASHFVARDGVKLTFRAYPAPGNSAKGSVVLVHGSSASGVSMHVMAKGFAAAGYTAYALDIRGHGGSGTRGRIAYVGQLEDDLEDFVSSVKPDQPATLVGFSSGGGFGLRFAGSTRQKLFSGYLLLSPFISQKAPTYRPNSGGWVNVGVPRFVAIALLNAMGIRAFNDLPVTKFALNEGLRRSSPRNIPLPWRRTSGLSVTTGPTSALSISRFGSLRVKTTKYSMPSASPKCLGLKAKMSRSHSFLALGTSRSRWSTLQFKPLLQPCAV